MLHPTSILPALALVATTVAQTGWVQMNPATQPPPRAYHAITYDALRGVTVLFGGWDGGLPLRDTWEWNGVNWTQRLTSVTPPGRYGNALAFDIGRTRVVLFGGTSSSITGDLNDTWEFDGSNWTQMQPANPPSLRRMARMEYDTARARIVLFGGAQGINFWPCFNDTWEWDGVAWTLRSPATSPTARWGHGMTYDFARARIVLFGGSRGGTQQLMDDTWTWDGTDWSQALTPAPTPTAGHGLAHDTASELVVRFGGLATGVETWLFDHVAWRRDPRTTMPQWLQWCALGHDILRGRTVLFGGMANSTAVTNETWEYDPGPVARWKQFGSGCAGTSGVPVLRSVGASLPIVGTSFVLELRNVPGAAAAISFGFSNLQWNGNTLPWDLGAIGMTGCSLHASPDFLFSALVVSGSAGLAWLLPNDPGLVGIRFFNQGFVLDPGINPTGATVSNAGAGTIGPF